MSKTETPDYIYLGISDEARQIFDSIADIYSEKIDIALDFASLAIYAESCVRLKKFYEMTRNKNPVVKSKNGETYIHPLFNQITKCTDEISRFATKLGLEPNARKKIDLDLLEIKRRKNGKKSAVDEVLGL